MMHIVYHIYRFIILFNPILWAIREMIDPYWLTYPTMILIISVWSKDYFISFEYLNLLHLNTACLIMTVLFFYSNHLLDRFLLIWENIFSFEESLLKKGQEFITFMENTYPIERTWCYTSRTNKITIQRITRLLYSPGSVIS